MGWHADNEPHYGDSPTIVSVSLGARRDFDVRHNTSGRKLRVALGAGDVLVMRGSMQRHWQHAVPARRGRTPGAALRPRINLTFRAIIHPETGSSS